MDRDSKGRFKRKNEDDSDCETTGVLEKTPTLKTFLILILLGWLVYGFVPTPRDAGMKICSRMCECHYEMNRTEAFGKPESPPTNQGNAKKPY